MREYRVYASNSILIDSFDTGSKARDCHARNHGSVLWYYPDQRRWWERERRLA